MGKNSSDAECFAHSSGMVFCGATLVFLSGLMICSFSIWVFHMDGFQTAVRMADADMSDPWAGLFAAAVVGFATAVVAGGGGLAAFMENTGGVCAYFLACALCALFYFCAIFSTAQFETTIFPVMDRLSEEFCNASLHDTYTASLGCNTTEVGHVSCGEYCLKRVATIREMGGCPLLAKLCHNFAYHNIGQGNCLITATSGTAVLPTTFRTMATWDDCRNTCNGAIDCVGFATGEAVCTVVSKNVPRAGTWTPVGGEPVVLGQAITGTDGAMTSECFQKDTPYIISNLRRACTISVWLFAVASIIVASASCCACSMQYTMTTRKKGKKGAGALMGKMLSLGGGKVRDRKFDCPEEDSNEEDDEEQKLTAGRR